MDSDLTTSITTTTTPSVSCTEDHTTKAGTPAGKHSERFVKRMMDKFDVDAPPVSKQPRKYVKVSPTYLAAKKCTTERSAGQSLKGDKLPVQNLEISVPTVGESKDSSQQTLNSANEEGSQESPVTPQMDVISTGAAPSPPTDDISTRRAMQLRNRVSEGLLSVHPSALDVLGCLCTEKAQMHVHSYVVDGVLADSLSASLDPSQEKIDQLKCHAVDLEVLGFQTGWILEYVAELECYNADRDEVLHAYEDKKQACDEFKKKIADHEAELASEKKKIAERENELAQEKKKIAKRENELANNKKKIAELETELGVEPVVPHPPAPFPY